MSAAPAEVDVIIVGGGTAGSVVCGRLARADPRLQIAVIEDGRNNLDDPTVIQPAMYLSHLAPTSTSAHFWQAKENPAVAGRSCIVPTGRFLGGGSSINFMMATRGSASDFDDWKTEGWTYNDLLPLARKMETYHPPNGASKTRGQTGPLNISYGGHQSDLGKQFVKATQEVIDVPFKDDIQDFQTGHGLTNWPKWIDPKTGRRQDAAHCYVHPVMKEQDNIHLICKSRALRVLLDDDNRAVGVEYCDNPLADAPLNPEQPPTVGEVKTIMARKLVIVSSGALGTPGVLERSGIGKREVLEKAGVECKVELDGVGSNYEDHQLCLSAYHVDPEEETLDDYLRGIPEVHAKVGEQWAKDGSGLVATNAIDAGFKWRPTEEQVKKMSPEFQKVWREYFAEAKDKPVCISACVSSLLGDHSMVPAGKYCMTGAYLMYPKSQGYVHIKSSNPYDMPDFDAAFLKDEADVSPQVEAYKVVRNITRRMKSYRGEFAPTHPKFSPTSEARCRDPPVEDAKKATDGKDISVGVAAAGLPSAVGNAAAVPGDDKQTTRHPADDHKDIEYTEEDDKAIEQWIRENVATTWHSCSTCRMMPKEQGGVVDGRLNVYGTKGLKLADLSIIPANVGTNTYSCALTVGEKAAVIAGEDLGIAV